MVGIWSHEKNHNPKIASYWVNVMRHAPAACIYISFFLESQYCVCFVALPYWWCCFSDGQTDKRIIIVLTHWLEWSLMIPKLLYSPTSKSYWVVLHSWTTFITLRWYDYSPGICSTYYDQTQKSQSILWGLEHAQVLLPRHAVVMRIPFRVAKWVGQFMGHLVAHSLDRLAFYKHFSSRRVS